MTTFTEIELATARATGPMSKNVKRTLTSLAVGMAVSVMMTGCGGGGGGSSKPNPAQPAIPTVPPVTPVTPPSSPPPTNPGDALTSVVVPPTPTQLPALLNVLDPINVHDAHVQGLTGKGVTVGVVDSDFDVSDSELAGRINKTVYTAGGANGNRHGAEVSQVLAGRSGKQICQFCEGKFVNSN